MIIAIPNVDKDIPINNFLSKLPFTKVATISNSDNCEKKARINITCSSFKFIPFINVVSSLEPQITLSYH
jgi:hypothetical protein